MMATGYRCSVPNCCFGVVGGTCLRVRCMFACRAGCTAPVYVLIQSFDLAYRAKLDALTDEIREKFRSLEEEYR